MIGPKAIKMWIGLIGLGLLAAGCTPTTVAPTATGLVRNSSAILTPFRTATPPASTASPTAPKDPPVSLQPTPTPFVHEIVADDTLLGIALRYGVQVEDILAANPGIDPRLLSIGMTITVPLSEEGAAALPTAEPLPLELEEPRCYRLAGEGAWCFVLANNPLEQPVESLTAQLALLDQAGNVIATQQIATPLNLIPAGAGLPLYGYFHPPLPEEIFPRVELVSAFPAFETDERYIALVADESEIVISEDGLSAHIRGELQVAEGDKPAGRIRLAAIGYDGAGQVAGLRIWEYQQALQPGEQLAYDLVLYSLGEGLERVEVFSEGRP